MLEIFGRKISKEELLADTIFFSFSFVFSVLSIFVFDIHWNFYPGGSIWPPEVYIFQSPLVYVFGGLGGAIVGFFLIKLFLYGLREQEIVWKKAGPTLKKLLR